MFLSVRVGSCFACTLPCSSTHGGVLSRAEVLLFYTPPLFSEDFFYFFPGRRLFPHTGMGNKNLRSTSPGLWTVALLAFLIAGSSRKLLVRHNDAATKFLSAPSPSPKGFWMALQQETVAADAARSVSGEYFRRLPQEQRVLCERFSRLCLDTNKNSTSSFRGASLKERVKGTALAEMTDFALTAPVLLSSHWAVFAEMVMQLAILKNKYLCQLGALQERLAPFMLPRDGAPAAETEAEGDLALAAVDTAASAADAAAATAAAASAEGTSDGIDMEYVRFGWKELQQLAEEEQQVATSYLALAAEGSLFGSPPDDYLWTALLRQVAAKAASVAKAAKHGLAATCPDLYREGTEGYSAAFAAVAAADDRLRLLLLEQQDTYAGSQPVVSFLRAIILSFCEPGECNGNV